MCFSLALWQYPLSLLAVALIAQAGELTPQAQYEGKTVAHIRFDPPTQPLVPAELTRLVAVFEGAPLHLADIRATIKRLYGTGEYTEVEVDTETTGDGLTLIFRTAAQWFVGPVDIRGKVHAPPNVSQLTNATQLNLGTPFDDTDMTTAVNNLRDVLQRNGLYSAAIAPTVTRDPDHRQVSITFLVKSGKRARFTMPVVIGDTKIPAADLARAAKYKEIFFFPWKPVTEAATQTGLENIRHKYEKQDRLTASVELDHMDHLLPQNRVRPTIRADGGPKIEFQSEGAKVSKGTLRKYVPVFDEGTVNRDLLVAGTRNLRDYFQNRGYFDVQVDFSSRQTSQDVEKITYTVSPGDTHRLVSVEVKGNRYFSTPVIRERMYLQPKGFIRFRHGRYSQSFASRDEQSIQALYRDNGFRDCHVTANVIDDYRGEKGSVAITIEIDEGPQYLVSSLKVNGITREDKNAIISKLTSSAGQPFSDTSVGLDRNYILDQYQSAGYPNATFDFHATPAGPHRFDLEYDIGEGMPQYVRDVLISGLYTSRRRLIAPLISLHPGDPLSWNEMGRMQRHFYNLGVFDKVDIAIQNPDGDTQQKYVDFHCVEGHLYTVAVGVGAELAKIGGSASSVGNPTGVTGFAPRFDL
jgi:outer membrane protein assembly factor BamA